MVTFVEIREAVKMALSALWTNKFRSIMTIIGVMVGVAAVIGMASVINGLDYAAKQEVDRRGSNIIRVSKWAPGTDWDDLTDEERNRKPITVAEAEAIMENCPSVDGVAPQNYYWKPGGNEAKYSNRVFENPNLMGTWPDYVQVRERNIVQGRFLSDVDERFRLMVAVIGSDIAETLFPRELAVGKEIRVNGRQFEVIGVLERQKSNFGGSFENKVVIIPLSTFGKLHPWEEELGLDVRAESYEKIDQAKEEITSVLRQYRKVPFGEENNFALSTQEQFKEQIEDITKYIYLAGLVITSVGLMVGGIGVMNIMLVSVTERTREIGIRKAIGATRTNIIMQFLTEAMTLSGSGGVVGILFGIGLGVGINALLGFPLTVSIFWMIIGFVVAVSVGLASGIYPAIKAAWLDPIEALRYE
ncbi:FtsX-like permease family protein [candidate division GN15 bacterium]|nr:FtsX-like permease family protein [candidate division GN15 bacterium]